MQTEIEAKWLGVNITEMRLRLKTAGAKLEVAERLMRRSVYDYLDGRLETDGAWVRVRDEGDKVTMSFKQMHHRTLHGMQEVVLVVDDYEVACSFLRNLGMKQKSYQETKRESWSIEETQIELDTWPWVPSFIEIEAKDETAVRHTAELLGLNYIEAKFGGVEPVYTTVYQVTDAEVNSWPEILFTPVPDWLEAKRR